MKDISEPVGQTKRPSHVIPRDGGKLIKGFVQEAEQRRVACRFARTGRGFTSRPHMHVTGSYSEDDRLETRSGTPISTRGNQEKENTAAVVQGLFAKKHMQRNRQISLTPAMLPAAAAAAATGMGVNNKPIFTFARRKLQMESVNATATSGSAHRSAALMASPGAIAVTSSQQLGHRPRASKLAAKLDAILRSSPWMRRKVVIQPQSNNQSQRGFSNPSSPRLLSNHPTATPPLHPHQEAIDASSGSANEKHHRRHRHSSEREKRAMATFQRFVRLWRERKKRSEQAALNIVNGNGSTQQNTPSTNGTNNVVAGRHGVKLRRELDAQSSNVASILSRRVIGEVPALKFFDEGEPLSSEQATNEPTLYAFSETRSRSSEIEDKGDHSPCSANISTKPPSQTIGDLMTSLSFRGESRRSPIRRAAPRGVCYTLDGSGCRRIKMQSGAAVQRNRSGGHTSQSYKKSEVITVEKATSKTLRRRMIRRVKIKHQAISRVTDDFRRSQNVLTAKLGSQLALRQAEGERMFSKRLSLLMSNNTELPPHLASKELALARLRFKKANLQARCQTLAVLGAALHHIETAGEVSGLELSSGEQHFLELLRCAVEGDHTLTPLLIDGISCQFNSEQRQKPLIAGLLGLLKRTPAPSE